MIYNSPLICHLCKNEFRWFIYNVSPEYGYLECKCQKYPIVYSIPIFTDIPFKDYLIKLITKRNFLKALSVILTYSSSRAMTNFTARLARKLGSYSYEDKKIKKIVYSYTDSFQHALNLLNTERESVNFMLRYAQPSFVASAALFSLINEIPLLSIGCGVGHIERLISRNINPLGFLAVDFHFHFLYLSKKFIAPEVNFICADANKTLPLKTAAFKSTILSDVFSYIENKNLLAQEISRVTAADGKILNAWINLKHNYIGPKPLAIDEYRKIFSDYQIFDARKVITDWKERKINLLTDSVDKATDVITIVKAPNNFFQEHTIKNWPYNVGEPYRINPIYDTIKTIDKTKLTRKKEFDDKTLLELGYLPESLELSNDEIFSPSDELKFKLILVDIPDNYL